MAKQKSNEAEAKVPAASSSASTFPLGMLRDDIDRAFDRMFRDWPRMGGIMGRDLFNGGDDVWTKTSAVAPRVDVSEDDNSYEITAEMPGVEEKDIDVTVKEDRLTLRGEKKTKTEEKKKDYHMSERSYGSFERTFRLPKDVNAEKIKAEFSNGVLNVVLPKTPESKAKERKVAIKAK